MNFYRLNRIPTEDASEAEDWNEYFTSLAAARARRAELLQEWAKWGHQNGHRTGEDFSIDKVTIKKQSVKAMILARLNHDLFDSCEEVVPPVKLLEAKFFHPGDNDDHGLGEDYK